MLCEQSLQYLEYLACLFFVIVIPFCFFGIFLDSLSRNIYPTPTHYSCCGGFIVIFLNVGSFFIYISHLPISYVIFSYFILSLIE